MTHNDLKLWKCEFAAENKTEWLEKTELRILVNLLIFGLKSVFGGLKRKKKRNSLPTRKKTKPVSSWREMIKGKIFLNSILLVSTVFSLFVSDEKKEKQLFYVKIRSKIQTFIRLTTLRQKKDKIWLSTFWKLLKNIDLQTRNIKIYSLICNSSLQFDFEEKKITRIDKHFCISGGKCG